MAELEQKGAHVGPAAHDEDQLHDDAKKAFAAGKVGQAEGLEAAAAEPGFRRVGGDFSMPGARALAGYVEAPVGMKAHQLAGGQHHVGGAHDVGGAAAPEGVEAHAAGDEPAGVGAAQVGRVHGQRQFVVGETPVDDAHARSGAHDADVGGDVHVDVVETRDVERQAAVAGHRAAESRGRGAAHGDRRGRLASPGERRLHLCDRDRQKDDVGKRVAEEPCENGAEVDVLILVGLGAQHVVGDEALRQRGGMAARMTG